MQVNTEEFNVPSNISLLVVGETDEALLYIRNSLSMSYEEFDKISHITLPDQLTNLSGPVLIIHYNKSFLQNTQFQNVLINGRHLGLKVIIIFDNRGDQIPQMIRNNVKIHFLNEPVYPHWMKQTVPKVCI